MNRKRIIILASISLILVLIFIYFYKPSSSTDNEKKIKEDVNNDGQIDIVDITMVARAFGSGPGYKNWNPDADINKDGKVDNLDMYMVEEIYKKVKG